MTTKLISADEVRGMDAARRKEVLVDARKRLSDIKLDIYTPAAQHVGEKRAAKKNLARIMTVLSEESAALRAKKKP